MNIMKIQYILLFVEVSSKKIIGKFANKLVFNKGSFGSEQIMNSYPAIAFLLILLIPLLWNLPISLITSELGLAMPSNEGDNFSIKPLFISFFLKNKTILLGIFIWIHQAFVKPIFFRFSSL